MTERARVARIEELPAFPFGGVTMRPVRSSLDVSAFGVNAYTADTGEQLIEEHDEMGPAAGRHEELYAVIAGRATFSVADEEIDAPAGTLVLVPDPQARRGAVAAEPGTSVLVVGAPVGEPYVPSPWEISTAAAMYAQRGDRERARALVDQTLSLHAGHPRALYNVACAEALLGERDAALEHLRAAIAGEPEAAEWARGDDDLVSIRDDPRWPA